MQAVRGHFRPEFLNRLDEILIFRRLSRENMAAIVRADAADAKTADSARHQTGSEARSDGVAGGIRL